MLILNIGFTSSIFFILIESLNRKTSLFKTYPFHLI